jgi:C4-type Zn-finger protein
MTTFFIALVFVPDAHIELLTMFYCPVCKSQEIYPVAGGYLGQIYACKKCKYRGSFVLEIDENSAVPDETGKE